jgi:hypothetical protein
MIREEWAPYFRRIIIVDRLILELVQVKDNSAIDLLTLSLSISRMAWRDSVKIQKSVNSTAFVCLDAPAWTTT